MQLCIFEGSDYESFEPLIYMRPVYDLVCGISTLRSKILRAYPGIKYSLLCRKYIEDFVKVQNPGIDVNEINGDGCLFINGKVIAPPNINKIIPHKGEDKVYKSGNAVIAARVSGKRLNEIKTTLSNFNENVFDELPSENIDIRYADYVWNLIEYNAEELIIDFKQLIIDADGENIRGNIYGGVHLIEKDNIFIGADAEIKPGVVIDASNGPVYIDKKSIISPNAVIESSVYIGEGSKVKSCSTIFQNVSVGHTCKVGGEVEDSIILPYSNKQHSGFLGHAYLGSWVNIGADTNNSDLRNNYGSIKIYTNGAIIDTKMQFLGLIMGDHSKTAINTMFNTGTVTGVSANVYGAGFPDKYLPSFSWGGAESSTTYDVEKSIETAKRMMGRRKKEMSSAEENLFRTIFDITKTERVKRGYPY